MNSDEVNSDDLILRFREFAAEQLPFPGAGETSHRLLRLMEIGREDLSLARLAEAHFDACAILAEGGRKPFPNALYGVWAAEIPGNGLTLTERADAIVINGSKMFCSGAGIVDRALLTADPYLIEIDLRSNPFAIQVDTSAWKPEAFALTNTATIQFKDLPASRDAINLRDWYLSRAGFWHGACGPAACWAGGASGLVDYACRQSRSDPHTLAHLGAMRALVWQMKSSLEAAGREIDLSPEDADIAKVRALMLRHVVEQACTEILRRFARAYGPFPLAFDAQISRRYHELDIYLRQCHGERDLETLERDCRSSARLNP
jgi:alkylation response protein AidB-like acyl-CoA dehydrogenase